MLASNRRSTLSDDYIELVAACEDVAGLLRRNKIGDILRGAALSPAHAVGPRYAAAVSNLSPLFKLPVDAVQRGRDHGLPTYNAAREVSSRVWSRNSTTSFRVPLCRVA